MIDMIANFRRAIERARDNGYFIKDISFMSFPLGCCGDTCDLLAQFLQDVGIRTYYISGTYASGNFHAVRSHAWLETEDGTVIDITGDQFKDLSEFGYFNYSVYVGLKTEFHNLFEVRVSDISLNQGIRSLGYGCQSRLLELYDIICDQL